MNEKEHERRAEFSAAASISDELRGDEHRSGESAAVAALWRSTSPLADTHGYSRFGGLGVPGLPSLMGGVPGSLGGVLHAPIQKRAGGGLQVGEHTGFLRMRGLPFSVGKEDILSFFLEYNPIPDSIVLTYRNDGRATGEAYIGFTNPEDSLRAMDLHRRSMGSRYIELFISNKEEHGRALARFGSR
jgi:heterogeneous nuclear ribonucleoprotein F/H